MNANMLEELLDDIKSKYPARELSVIREYLSPFCPSGQLYALRIFERAALLKQRWLFEVLLWLFTERNHVWNKNPQRIGDPDDVLDGHGWKIACALWEIYIALGINKAYKGLH